VPLIAQAVLAKEEQLVEQQLEWIPVQLELLPVKLLSD